MTVVVESVDHQYSDMFLEPQLEKLFVDALKILPLSSVPIEKSIINCCPARHLSSNCYTYLSMTAPMDCSTALASVGST